MRTMERDMTQTRAYLKYLNIPFSMTKLLSLMILKKYNEWEPSKTTSFLHQLTAGGKTGEKLSLPSMLPVVG